MRGLVGLLGVVLAVAPARAENYFTETHYELGYQSVSNVAFATGSADGGGLRVTEYNGVISRVPYALFVAFAAAQSEASRMKISVTTSNKESYYEVKNGQGTVVERVKIVSPVTTLSFSIQQRSPEEQKLIDEHLERVGQSMGMLAKLSTHFDLMYMPERDNSRIFGIRGALYPAAFAIGRHMMLGVGYSGAHLKARVPDGTGSMQVLKYRSRAIAAIVGIAPVRYLLVTAEVHPNLLDLDDADGRYGTTVRATATLSIPKIDRLYAKVGAERLGFTANSAWNTVFEAGMRF